MTSATCRDREQHIWRRELRRCTREVAWQEHGFADLKCWRILTKVRMNARHATTLLRALLALTNAEIQR
ncbi:hypothetical protein ABZ192_42715 [Streptomyces sp. NPDC006235]|uniref:hypothetical protein n=1 Tax=Streptomyces sp. NPDC006235 TaxID=3156736 RepID=UPI0033A8FE6B